MGADHHAQSAPTRKLGRSAVVLFLLVVASAVLPAAAAQAATFAFPSSGSTVVGSETAPPGAVGAFWSGGRGDSVAESFSGPPRVDHATLSLQAVENSLVPGAQLDWILSINGTDVESFTMTAADGTDPIVVSASFPLIAGPTYAVKLRLTNNIYLGDGSVTLASADPGLHSLALSDEAPDTHISAGPPARGTETSATFSFDAAAPDLEAFQCSLDHTNFVPCASPRTYTALAVGAHSFEVSAVDAGGHVDPTPATWTWTVEPPADATPPGTTITGGPAAITGATTASFNFVATEFGARFECKLDTAGFAPCGRPQAYAGLGQGPHAFAVRAIDAAGNVGAASTWSWTVASPPATPTTGETGPATARRPVAKQRKCKCRKGFRKAKRHGHRTCIKRTRHWHHRL